MPEKERARQPEAGGVSLRLRITLTFLLAGGLLSAILSYTAYRIIDASLLSQAQARVLDLAKLAAAAVDVESLSRLETGLAPYSGPAQSVQAGGPAEYRSLSAALDRVRSVEPQLVKRIFLIAPSGDLGALWLVDAATSRVGLTLELSNLPEARRTLTEKKAFAADAWTEDPAVPGRILRLEHLLGKIEQYLSSKVRHD